MSIPRGIRNCNPGNIERSLGPSWQGASPDQSGDARFVVFRSAEWGIRALVRTLLTYNDHRRARDGSRIDTLREIIERWAPPTENNTQAYLMHVAGLVRLDPDARINLRDYGTMWDVVVAIITHENGTCPYSDAQLREGLALAGLLPTGTPA